MPVLALSAFTGQVATGVTLCQQLARAWASRSTLVHPDGTGLTFAEDSSNTPANLYAIPLPRLAHRRAHAASITTEAETLSAGEAPAWTFGVVVECHAKTQREAVNLGADLVRRLLPERGQWNEPVTREGVELFGAVGFPALTPGQEIGLWRVLRLEVAGGPRLVPQATPTGRTPDGQDVAVVRLIVEAISLEWQEPVG